MHLDIEDIFLYMLMIASMITFSIISAMFTVFISDLLIEELHIFSSITPQKVYAIFFANLLWCFMYMKAANTAFPLLYWESRYLFVVAWFLFLLLVFSDLLTRGRIVFTLSFALPINVIISWNMAVGLGEISTTLIFANPIIATYTIFVTHLLITLVWFQFAYCRDA